MKSIDGQPPARRDGKVTVISRTIRSKNRIATRKKRKYLLTLLTFKTLS